MPKRMRKYDSGVITAAVASETMETLPFRGFVEKVQIVTSASNDFAVFVDSTAAGAQALKDEYLVGASGVPLTVADSVTLYPRTDGHDADGSARTGANERYYVEDKISMAITGLTALDTYRVVIWYEETE